MLTRVWAKRSSEDYLPRIEQHIGRCGILDSYYYIDINNIRRLVTRKEAVRIINHYRMTDESERAIYVIEYDAWKRRKIYSIIERRLTFKELLGSALCFIALFLALGTAGALDAGVITLSRSISQFAYSAILGIVGSIII